MYEQFVSEQVALNIGISITDISCFNYIIYQLLHLSV